MEKPSRLVNRTHCCRIYSIHPYRRTLEGVKRGRYETMSWKDKFQSATTLFDNNHARIRIGYACTGRNEGYAHYGIRYADSETDDCDLRVRI
jgi:hypothetical protein